MGFMSGNVSYRRFSIAAEFSNAPDEKILDALRNKLFAEHDLGIPEEIESGWVGGRHIMDAQISFERNVFGEALLFGLRIDSNKIPGELRKAYQLMEEDAQAAAGPKARRSKADIKDTVRQKLEDELRSGRFRKSKLLPVLWDFPSATLLCPASAVPMERLCSLFEETFGSELLPESMSSLMTRLAKGHLRDLEDAKPTRFVLSSEGQSAYPEYPWTAKMEGGKDFLANELLLWLWFESEQHAGVIATPSGDVSLLIEKSIDLDCAYGTTGKDSLKSDAPTRMPEARDALRTGKVPRKISLTLEHKGLQAFLAWSPESATAGGLKLPDVEDADNERALVEERVTMLRDFNKSLDAVVTAFAKVRFSSSWDAVSGKIRRWIKAPAPTPAVHIDLPPREDADAADPDEVAAADAE